MITAADCISLLVLHTQGNELQSYVYWYQYLQGRKASRGFVLVYLKTKKVVPPPYLHTQSSTESEPSYWVTYPLGQGLQLSCHFAGWYWSYGQTWQMLAFLLRYFPGGQAAVKEKTENDIGSTHQLNPWLLLKLYISTCSISLCTLQCFYNILCCYFDSFTWFNYMNHKNYVAFLESSFQVKC